MSYLEDMSIAPNGIDRLDLLPAGANPQHRGTMLQRIGRIACLKSGKSAPDKAEEPPATVARKLIALSP